MPRTVILIPCYNESLKIDGVVKGSLKFTDDVIVVDDGSTDGTGDIAKNAGAVLLRHAVNKGKGESLRTGFDYIKENKKWDAVIIMDGDGQHDPEEIPQFINNWQKDNVSIVVGNRMGGCARPEDMPFIRWLTNKVTSYIISKIAGQYVPDTQCGYRLIAVNVLNEIELLTSRFDTESEMLIEAGRKGLKISSLPIRIIYGGETSYINPFKDTIRFIRLVYDAVFRN